MIRRLLVIAALAAMAEAREFYVAPDGKRLASGSIDDPWDLATALGAPAEVKPGDVIWLRGGVHGNRNTIFSKLRGTAENPIVVRGYPGERATVDAGLAMEGESVWYWDFEITSSNTDRTDRASNAPDAIICRAPNTKIINLVIHDTRQGMGVWMEAPDTEIYGNLIYYNGFQGGDRAHGHGIYFQNKDGVKLISDNIVFDQFYAGIHGYGTNAAYVNNVTIDGNIVFSNGQVSARQQFVDQIVLWPGNPMENIVVKDNLTYQPPKAIGYSRIGTPDSAQHRNLSATGNYFIGGYIAVMMSQWSQAEFRNNTVYSDDGYVTWLEYSAGQKTSDYSWDENRYFGKSFLAVKGPGDDKLRLHDWNGWRAATAVDASSSYQAGKPAGEWTFLRPNKYDANRAHIAIYNWNARAEVGVDLSAALNAGDTFEIRDAMNYYGAPVASGTYAGGSVSIPMTGLTPAEPVGMLPTAPRHTAPEFGAFILIRTGRAAE